MSKKQQPKSNQDKLDVVPIKPLAFPNAVAFAMKFNPKLDLYKWQIEELLRGSGHLDGKLESKQFDYTKDAYYNAIYNTNNGSGKDSVLVCILLLFWLTKYVQMDIVVTSASYTQLRGQTEKYLRDMADVINEYLGEKYIEYKELHFSCPKTRSTIQMFSTNTPGRSEGFHPRAPGRKFAMVLNEVKSLDEDQVRATLRCDGYTHWLEVSSPGRASGHFYKSVTTANRVYPAPMVPGTSFTRTITANDCPHVSVAHIKRLADLVGVNSSIFRSSILAQFTDEDNLLFITPDKLNYPEPLWCVDDNIPHAGVDLSLGGDETAIVVRIGNKIVAVITFRKSGDALINALVATFISMRLSPKNIVVDAGGIGAMVISQLATRGWPVIGAKNEDTDVIFQDHFLNKGAENYFRVKRFIEEQKIILPKDPKTLKQLTSRRYVFVDNSGKIKCEFKKAHIAREGESPDRADAFVLAFYGLNPAKAFKYVPFGHGTTSFSESLASQFGRNPQITTKQVVNEQQLSLETMYQLMSKSTPDAIKRKLLEFNSGTKDYKQLENFYDKYGTTTTPTGY
jgi:hypothetical protein